MSETHSQDQSQRDPAVPDANDQASRNGNAEAVSDDAIEVVEIQEGPTSPVVEILPPEYAELDPNLPDVTVDRTQFSVGLSGLSVKRTHMSTASSRDQAETPQDGAPETDASAPPDKDGPASSPAAVAEADSHDVEFQNSQLFTRYLIGFAIYGVDEILERIQRFDKEIADNPEDYDLSDHLLERLDETEESVEALVRYWAIGALLWSQRSALGLTYRSFQASIDVSHHVLRGADRSTDNILFRPVRRPVEKLVGALVGGAKARIAEGRTVETRDRVLAQLTLNDIVSDIIDYMSENPELTALISEQGFGLASTIMDNGRQVGAMSDNAVEKLVRKIFRREPRQDLTQSPLIGKPQDMYDPGSEAYNIDRKSDQNDE